MSADYVKYTKPLATTLSLLAWSVVEFENGYKSQVRISLALALIPQGAADLEGLSVCS